MASIRELAQRLDVSIGTVSRALNDRPGVNPETRALVLRMAEEIGYVANASGRSLRRGVTNTVGLVIETDNPDALGGNNFFIVLADAMQSVMTERGYDLVLLPCRRAASPLEFLRRVVRRGIVDGLVISATQREDPRIEFLLRSGLPFLTLGRSETPGDYAWIDLDFEAVARTSVERLVALGHRRIALAIPDDNTNLTHIYCGTAAKALAEHGLAPDPHLMMWASASECGGVEIVRCLLNLPKRPSAIMTCSETMAEGIYQGLAEAGLEPGRDMSVISFRDSPRMRYLSPPPSCFHLLLEPLGVMVAKIITDIAARREAENERPRQVIWPMHFQETASIQPPSQFGR